jgi:predicted ester cyclase
VSIDRLPKDSWKESRSPFLTSRNEYQKEASALADYFKEQLNKKIAAFPKGTFSVADATGEATLVFDIALTELEFSHPVTKAGMLLVPVPGASVAFSAVSDPHVAFAARVYDGVSGKLVATLGDRKFPPVRVIDLSKLTVTSSTREIVATWAEIFAEGLNRDRFVRVRDKGIFRILPW